MYPLIESIERLLEADHGIAACNWQVKAQGAANGRHQTRQKEALRAASSSTSEASWWRKETEHKELSEQMLEVWIDRVYNDPGTSERLLEDAWQVLGR